MAAQQAAEIYEDAEVTVIPSKNLGTGYVGISSLNTENPDAKSVSAEVEAAMSRVTAGYISPAIRDADMNGVHINNGDTIGIVDKEIVVSKPGRTEAAHALIDFLLSDTSKFMLTVFCGKDSTAAEQAGLEEYILESHSDIEVYFINGGQEIYPYIFVAE